MTDLVGQDHPADIRAFWVSQAPVQHMACDGHVVVANNSRTGRDVVTINAGPIIQRARQHPKEYAAIHFVARGLFLQQPLSTEACAALPRVAGRPILEAMMTPFMG